MDGITLSPVSQRDTNHVHVCVLVYAENAESTFPVVEHSFF